MDMLTQSNEKGNHISGIDRGKIVMYGLSTCVWCKRTKKLLADLGVEHDYIFVDKLDKDEEKEALEVIKHFNPSVSFPITIINGEKAIVGFKEKQIKEALGF